MIGWKYYNHAVIPSTPPHDSADITPLQNGSIWKMPEKPLLARWTSDFDCGYETNWWYCIKDNPFDISCLSSKKRYEIRKGIKNFIVINIDPLDYVDEIYQTTLMAYSTWPRKYRPVIDEIKFKEDIKNWKDRRVLAAFEKDTNEFAGYCFLTEHEDYAEFNVLRVKTGYEKKGVNAGIVNGVLEFYRESLGRRFYLLDGARNINHETHFQDYLEKYFQFRKAYCNLHIEYSPKIKLIVKFLYPFRNLLIKFDSIGVIHQLNSIFKMEEIVRQ